MSSNNKNFIHYRTLSKSNHLASDDLIGGDPVTVTIKRSYVGKDLNNKVKEPRAIIEFVEQTTAEGMPLKPMLLNMTNANTIAKISGTPNVLDWAGTRLEIYVQGGIRLGNDVVDGLRIRPAKPTQPKKNTTDEEVERMAEAIKVGSYSEASAKNVYFLSSEQIAKIDAAHNEFLTSQGGQNAPQN